MNFLWFYLSEKVFILSPFLKDLFTSWASVFFNHHFQNSNAYRSLKVNGYKVPHSYPCKTVKISLHCLLAYSKSVKKSLLLPLALYMFISFYFGCLQEILLILRFHQFDVFKCILFIRFGVL